MGSRSMHHRAGLKHKLHCILRYWCWSSGFDSQIPLNGDVQRRRKLNDLSGVGLGMGLEASEVTQASIQAVLQVNSIRGAKSIVREVCDTREKEVE